MWMVSKTDIEYHTSSSANKCSLGHDGFQKLLVAPVTKMIHSDMMPIRLAVPILNKLQILIKYLHVSNA
jgi:hypothetical protein